MASSLISVGTFLGLNEAGLLALLLAIVCGGMAIAVAAVLRQSYQDQKVEVMRLQRKVRSIFRS